MSSDEGADPAPRRPVIRVVQPEGWIRLRFDESIDEQISAVARAVVADLEPSRRDLARVRLLALLRTLVAETAGRAYEVWLPVSTTGGVQIPVSITIGPLPTQPDSAVPVADVLLGIAAGSPGSRAVDVGGRLALRTTTDIAGVRDAEGEQWTSFPRRRITTVVARGGDDPWLAFVAEVIVPASDDAAEVVAASEFFVDALLATVRFDGESIADAAERIRRSPAASPASE